MLSVNSIVYAICTACKLRVSGYYETRALRIELLGPCGLGIDV